jgi:hypothetical protein
MFMRRRDALGYAQNDQAVAVIAGTIRYIGDSVTLTMPDGQTLRLPEGTRLENAPSRHARLPANTLSWRDR